MRNNIENTHDDWLSKEKLRESRSSVWDFDEGYKVKKRHQDNCAREKAFNEHVSLHNSGDFRRREPSSSFKAVFVSILMFIIMFFVFVFLIMFRY